MLSVPESVMIYSIVKIQLKTNKQTNLYCFLLENRIIDKKSKLTADSGLKFAGVWYVPNRRFLSVQEIICNGDKIQVNRAQRSTT